MAGKGERKFAAILKDHTEMVNEMCLRVRDLAQQVRSARKAGNHDLADALLDEAERVAKLLNMAAQSFEQVYEEQINKLVELFEAYRASKTTD